MIIIIIHLSSLQLHQPGFSIIAANLNEAVMNKKRLDQPDTSDGNSNQHHSSGYYRQENQDIR